MTRLTRGDLASLRKIVKNGAYPASKVRSSRLIEMGFAESTGHEHKQLPVLLATEKGINCVKMYRYKTIC